jgi:hypothetical protein
VFEMQNCTGFLSQQCQAAYDPDSAYKWFCITQPKHSNQSLNPSARASLLALTTPTSMIAPHAAGFVKTPWFALQVTTHRSLNINPKPLSIHARHSLNVSRMTLSHCSRGSTSGRLATRCVRERGR